MVATPPQSIQRSSFWSKKFLWVVGGIVCLGILGWFWGQQKSLGTITVPEKMSIVSQEDPTKQMTPYQGKYFTFSYPQGFVAHLNERPVKFPMLEQELLVDSGVKSQKIAIVVQESNGSSLQEYGAYRLRDMDKKAYRKENIEQQGVPMTLFIKTEPPFERGVFWLFENKFGSIVVSSPTTDNGLQEILSGLLGTLLFQKQK